MRIRMKELKIAKCVADLYWEFDRMSSSGQETLEKLATLVGVATEKECEELAKKMENA